MSRQKLFPGSLSASLGRRLDSMPFQNFSDSAAGKVVPEIGQRTFNPTTAPITVFSRHSNYQRLNFNACSGSTRPALRVPSYLAAISFRCQANRVSGVTMVASSARAYVLSPWPSSEPTTLIIIQTESPTAELLAQNAVLLAEVIDHLQLPLVHPASEGRQYEPEWIQDS